MSVRVRIENVYDDGHESDRTVDLDEPDDSLDDWWDEVVFPETGDGHGIGKDLGSWYGATIVEAQGRPELVGLTYEWSD